MQQVADLIPKTIVQIIPGKKLISYTRHDELGHGGFAKVFRATKDQTGETFAIKITSKDRLAKPKVMQKHRAEVEIQMSLNHKNVVKAYDFFEDQKFTYLVLELCEGGSLKNLLRKKICFSEEETSRYMKDIVSGVLHLHDNKIIHRDLKLENFLIDKLGNVKIADFGLSAQLEHHDEKRHSLCGTPNYLSPEMITDSKNGISYEVDIWALGVSAFAMLTGQLPFQAADKKETYKQIRECNYSFPKNIYVSTTAKSFVQTVLKVEPSERPTALELMDHPLLHIKPAPMRMPRGAGKENCKENANQQENVMIEDITRPVPSYFVSRFCDHSGKYGLGYLLRNGTVGVCFNDLSRIAMDPHEEFVQYWDTYADQVPTIVDETNPKYTKKLTVLRKFSASLKKAAKLYEIPEKHLDPTTPLIHVKYWSRNDQATLFRMDNRDIQVNFVDRKKLIIFWSSRTLMVVSSLLDSGKITLLDAVDKKDRASSDERTRFLIAKEMLNVMSRGG